MLVGAGDIAACDSDGDEATALLLDALVVERDARVFTTGDNVYPSGRPEEFAACYDPSWGRHRARTIPAPGNHEYETPGAAGYFGYFGAAAGDATRGYYATDVGGWRVIVINSVCEAVGGCGAGSAQERWLRAELAATASRCVAAIWHHPRFNSGEHGNAEFMADVWRALHEAGADLVLNGHLHAYERFAPQDANGVADPTGPREIIVGTGGRSHYDFLQPLATSEVRHTGTFGVLVLTLEADAYAWEFVPAAGGTFSDSGREACR